MQGLRIVSISSAIGFSVYLILVISTFFLTGQYDVERKLLISEKYCAKGVATACDAVYKNEIKTG